MRRPTLVASVRPRRLPVKDMSLGDVLSRLALVSPEQYRAIDGLIRAVYLREWPLDDDPLLLVDRKTREH